MDGAAENQGGNPHTLFRRSGECPQRLPVVVGDGAQVLLARRQELHRFHPVVGEEFRVQVQTSLDVTHICHLSSVEFSLLLLLPDPLFPLLPHHRLHPQRHHLCQVFIPHTPFPPWLSLPPILPPPPAPCPCTHGDRGLAGGQHLHHALLHLFPRHRLSRDETPCHLFVLLQRRLRPLTPSSTLSSLRFPSRTSSTTTPALLCTA